MVLAQGDGLLVPKAAQGIIWRETESQLSKIAFADLLGIIQ